MEEQQWVIVQGPYQARKFRSDVLNLGPRQTADFPKRRGCPAYWTLCSPQKGVTYNYDPSFLLRGGSRDTAGRPDEP